MANFIIKCTNILYMLPFTEEENCVGDVLNQATYDILKYIYNAILIVVPIIVVALSTVDMARAAIAQDDKDMKAAASKAVKRIFIGIAIMFIPLILDTILKIAGLASGVCHIGLGG